MVARPEATRVLRRFLPREEGGTDRQQLKVQLEYSLAPVQLLPPEIQQMEGIAGDTLKRFFAGQFMNLLLTPRMPRDLLLRCHLDLQGLATHRRHGAE